MTVYEKLFGTPERAVKTLEALCRFNADNIHDCFYCPICSMIDKPCGVEFAKWLEQEINGTTNG